MAGVPGYGFFNGKQSYRYSLRALVVAKPRSSKWNYFFQNKLLEHRTFSRDLIGWKKISLSASKSTQVWHFFSCQVAWIHFGKIDVNVVFDIILLVEQQAKLGCNRSYSYRRSWHLEKKSCFCCAEKKTGGSILIASDWPKLKTTKSQKKYFFLLLWGLATTIDDRTHLDFGFFFKLKQIIIQFDAFIWC